MAVAMARSAVFLWLLSARAMSREAARACCPTVLMYCAISTVALLNFVKH
jgi:hypothetical protein